MGTTDDCRVVVGVIVDLRLCSPTVVRLRPEAVCAVGDLRGTAGVIKHLLGLGPGDRDLAVEHLGAFACGILGLADHVDLELLTLRGLDGFSVAVDLLDDGQLTGRRGRRGDGAAGLALQRLSVPGSLCLVEQPSALLPAVQCAVSGGGRNIEGRGSPDLNGVRVHSSSADLLAGDEHGVGHTVESRIGSDASGLH